MNSLVRATAFLFLIFFADQSFAQSRREDIYTDSLIERELAARLPRRPGQKEGRYAQLLGGEDGLAEEPVVPHEARGVDRVEALEARVDRLEDEIESLRGAVDLLRRGSSQS